MAQTQLDLFNGCVALVPQLGKRAAQIILTVLTDRLASSHPPDDGDRHRFLWRETANHLGRLRHSVDLFVDTVLVVLGWGKTVVQESRVNLVATLAGQQWLVHR